MKQISAEFLLNFTAPKLGQLDKNPKVVQAEIQEVFASALDSYLSKHDVDYIDIHAVLCTENLTVEDTEE